MEVSYKLHDSQYKIYNDPSRFRVLAAGRRFGKTVLAVVEMITVAMAKKDRRVWYIAPTYKQAKMIAWKMLLDMIPKEFIKGKPNEVELEVTLINGSEISLKGADNEDNLRGVGIHLAILDEFAMMKRNVWQEIIRPMLTDTLGKALFISTPKGKNHFWELWMRGIRKEAGYSSYAFKTADNPFIPRSEIKEAEEQVSQRYFRQEYEASFEDFTGLIWPEFEEDKHVVEPFALPDYFQKIGSIDFATTGTTASLFASIDDDGNLFITGEYYQQNKRASEVSDSIRGRAEVFYGDPAGRRKSENRNGVMFSLFDEYRDNGIYIIPAQNDVNAGINRVAEYFKAGKVKIFSTCKNLIDELKKYHWSEEKETSGGVLEPKPFKSYDHACDCLRYLVMSRVEGSKPEPKKIVRFSEADFERMEEQQAHYDEVA